MLLYCGRLTGRNNSLAYHGMVRFASTCPALQVLHDEAVLVVHDKYPKGMHHGLVIPRQHGLLDVSCLQRGHLPLLQHMRQQAQQFATRHPVAQEVCTAQLS